MKHNRFIAFFICLALLLVLPSCKKEDMQQYAWTIGQKSALIIDDTLEMTISEGLKTSVQYEIKNPTDITYYYGREYILEVMQNGEWYKMVPGPGMAHTLELLSLSPGESKTENTSWPCELQPGNYRLIKAFYPDEKLPQDSVLRIAAEFTIA